MGYLSGWTVLVYHSRSRGYTFGADPLRCLSYVPRVGWTYILYQAGGAVALSRASYGSCRGWQSPLLERYSEPFLERPRRAPLARGPPICPPAEGSSPVGPKYIFTTGQLFNKLTGTYKHPAAIKVLVTFSARQTVDITHSVTKISGEKRENFSYLYTT